MMGPGAPADDNPIDRAPLHLPAPDAMQEQRIDELMREMSAPRERQAP